MRKSQHFTFKFKKEFSFPSVIIVLLRLSLLVWNFTRLKIFTPVLLVVLVTIRRSGATFWCFEASGRNFCSSSKGGIGAHFISFLAPSQLLVTLPVYFFHLWLIEKDNSNESKKWLFCQKHIYQSMLFLLCLSLQERCQCVTWPPEILEISSQQHTLTFILNLFHKFFNTMLFLRFFH